MLENLVGLAREKSSEKRRELMGRIADHFVEGSDNYSKQELTLFSQIISKLLEETDAQTRLEPQTPRMTSQSNWRMRKSKSPARCWKTRPT